MNTFQWVMLGAAAFLVVPMVFGKFKEFIPSTPIPPPVPPEPNRVDSCNGLVDVVE